jgi:hypothetical protein
MKKQMDGCGQALIELAVLFVVLGLFIAAFGK